MLMIFGKNNRLAYHLTIIYFQAVLHNDIKHLTNGVLIKQPRINSRRADFLRKISVLILKSILILFLFFIRQFIIANSLLNKL